MNSEDKLRILGASAKYDISCCGGSKKEVPNIPGIYYASGAQGKIVPILKTLFTNECKNNCLYCSNRVTADTPRTTFYPEELAALFMQIYSKTFVEGLFLSSGIKSSADQTMQKMIETAEILRYKHRFRGFIHLKVLPGAQPSLIKRAMQLATRVSVNIEAPSPSYLRRIAKGKDFMQGIIRSMEIIKAENEQRGEGPSQTTQFVVGAAGETDHEIVKTMDWLRRTKGIERTYFSAYTPVAAYHSKYNPTELGGRKQRLYQVEFLQRLYGFNFSEIYFDQSGKLPHHLDPKTNHALHNLDKYPIEINRAAYAQLLRIPGIGKILAQRIMQIRKEGSINDLAVLRKIGVVTKKAAPFILLNGKKQGEIKDLNLSEQLTLGI